MKENQKLPLRNQRVWRKDGEMAKAEALEWPQDACNTLRKSPWSGGQTHPIRWRISETKWANLMLRMDSSGPKLEPPIVKNQKKTFCKNKDEHVCFKHGWRFQYSGSESNWMELKSTLMLSSAKRMRLSRLSKLAASSYNLKHQLVLINGIRL